MFRRGGTGMTFAPDPLKALQGFIVAHGAVQLGVTGDTRHKKAGFSYHLGADDLKPHASSARLPRDVAGLSNAASAMDIGKVGGTFQGLRAMSRWLVAECLAGAPETNDIREIIYSADGLIVSRWDGKDGAPGVVRSGPDQGDKRHLKHTHISYFRDSETRDKVALFKRFFEEGDVRITAIKGEDWIPAVGLTGISNGVLRAMPDRSAEILERLPLETVVRTIAELSADGDSWRLTERAGKPVYLLRTDWTPVVQGGDPAIDAKLSEYIDRTAG
jgi:hypothetical protein